MSNLTRSQQDRRLAGTLLLLPVLLIGTFVAQFVITSGRWGGIMTFLTLLAVLLAFTAIVVIRSARTATAPPRPAPRVYPPIPTAEEGRSLA